MMREHLRAETNPQERVFFAQGHPPPVDFAPDKIVRVIRTHRPPEHDGTVEESHAFRQGIAEARAAKIKLITALAQRMPDPAGRCRFLTRHNENGLRHDALVYGRNPMACARSDCKTLCVDSQPEGQKLQPS